MSVVFNRVVVVGTGLIGASLAVAARRAGVFRHVVGVGRGRQNLEAALGSARVDAISNDPVAAVADADLVVLATPVDAALELLPAIARAAPPQALLTDVGSVKSAIVAAAEAAGVAARFVGGHPIAGGTATGAEAADAGLFSGKTVVLTPTADTTRAALDAVKEIWVALGAIILETSAANHDAWLARTSHLPQLAAFALAATIERRGHVPASLFGPGFRDTTRLADSDADMWAAIAKLNLGEILASMDDFSSTWRELRDAVAAGDETAFRNLIGEARRTRGRIPR
jgi:prephenate dehydrogenase